MNFGWLTTLDTKELNGSSMALFGQILHLEHLCLTIFIALLQLFCCTANE
jgi:hypothetical protein